MSLVTLISDFGLRDADVGITKGILYQSVPGIQLADISHEVRPFQMGEAAYLLGVTYRHYPPGTINFVLSDLCGGAGNRLILAKVQGWYFLAPDNGILLMALGKTPENCWLCHELPATLSYSECVRLAGGVVAGLVENPTVFTAGLNPCEPVQKSGNVHAQQLANEVACDVIHIDQFENIVLNYTRAEFEEQRRGRIFEVRFKKTEVINRISNNYADVRDGDTLCRFNSTGYLEICVRNGKAAGLLGIRLGSVNNEIKIVYE